MNCIWLLLLLFGCGGRTDRGHGDWAGGCEGNRGCGCGSARADRDCSRTERDRGCGSVRADRDCGRTERDRDCGSARADRDCGCVRADRDCGNVRGDRDRDCGCGVLKNDRGWERERCDMPGVGSWNGRGRGDTCGCEE